MLCTGVTATAAAQTNIVYDTAIHSSGEDFSLSDFTGAEAHCLTYVMTFKDSTLAIVTPTCLSYDATNNRVTITFPDSNCAYDEIWTAELCAAGACSSFTIQYASDPCDSTVLSITDIPDFTITNDGAVSS